MGTILPEEEAARAALAAAVRQLGSTAEPFATRPASWTLLTRRLADGWQPLAEGFSIEVGLVQSFGIRSDARSGRRRADRWRPGLEGRSDLPLGDEFARAAPSVEGVFSCGRSSVLGSTGWVLRAELDSGTQAAAPSLAWRGIPLATGARWQAVARVEGAPGTEARWELWIDGARRSEHRVKAGSEWLRWRVDLPPSATGSIDLELRPRMEGDGSGALLLGGARLVFGAQRRQ